MDKVSVEGLERVLRGVVEKENGVPGVVAMATDREANFYEGAAGERELGGGQEMTTDTVFALFSCTKAITGVAVMQLVEEGVLGWAGLANLYYWLDRRNDVGGFWATQILPFADPVSFGGYMEFETAVYSGLRSGTPAAV